MEMTEKLVYLRKKSGLTQLELAAKINVTRQAVSRWESGFSVPNTDNLLMLAELYGVPLRYIVNDEVPSDAPEPEEADSLPVLEFEEDIAQPESPDPEFSEQEAPEPGSSEVPVQQEPVLEASMTEIKSEVSPVGRTEVTPALMAEIVTGVQDAKRTIRKLQVMVGIFACLLLITGTALCIALSQQDKNRPLRMDEMNTMYWDMEDYPCETFSWKPLNLD